MSGAYYNEFDPKAAAWLRELIRQGHIAPGIVDERSIADVRPADLVGFTQCHFFAGIGVWSYALRLAGWPDDRPVWTGSCPCQPFSDAGAGGEFDDARHLWPAWFGLVRVVRPVAVFGEQVASKDALAWLDHVSTDLEGAGYTFGAVDTCAAGFGAPHIRQRLFFVAHSALGADERGFAQSGVGAVATGDGALLAHRLVDALGSGLEGHGRHVGDGHEPGRVGALAAGSAAAAGGAGGVALGDPEGGGLGVDGGASRGPGYSDESGAAGVGPVADTAVPVPSEGREQREREQRLHAQGGRHHGGEGVGELAPGPTNGFWADADWLPCRDGKARPVEPGTFPLAHGAPERVGRLRGYGNGLVAYQAAGFVEVAREEIDGVPA